MEFKARQLSIEDLSVVMVEEKETWGDLSADEVTVKERLSRYPPGNIGLFDSASLVGKCIWQPIYKITYDWGTNVARENCNPSGVESYVINFDVHPSYQGKGASHALMQASLESMQKQGIKLMWLGGRGLESNRRFYEKWLDYVEDIPNYWSEDLESKGVGVLYKRDLANPIARKVA